MPDGNAYSASKGCDLGMSRRPDEIDDEFALPNRNTDRVRLVPSSTDCSTSLEALNHWKHDLRLTQRRSNSGVANRLCCSDGRSAPFGVSSRTPAYQQAGKRATSLEGIRRIPG
jgi:hypothetical protein